MAKKNTTIKDLAVMINHSFTETQQHMDAQVAALKGELTGIMKDMAEELTATHEDVRDVRTSVNMLVRTNAAHEAAIESLRKRVERVERKVGIAK
jgi:hypothetical protein